MSATAQENKEQIISALEEARGKILEVASALPPEKGDEVFLGVWSVKDLLAHLAGWDYTNIEATKSILQGEVPEFYAHHDRDWATYNALLVARHKKAGYEELLTSVEESHRALITCQGTVPAEEFDRDRGVRFKRYKVTIARLLQAEAEDEEEHYVQIKEFAAGDSPRGPDS